MADLTAPDLVVTPLSSAQRALWSSQRLHPDSPLQNMALLSHLDGPVDLDRLCAAFASVVAASDTLRSRIVEHDGRTQLATVPPEAVDPTGVGNRFPHTEVILVPRDAVRSWADERVRTPIDPTVTPFDSVLVRHEDGTCSWYLSLHHVITDAASSALVFEATAAAYEGRTFEIGSYQQWVEARADRADTPREARARAHWGDRPAAPVLTGLYQPVREPTPENRRHAIELPSGLFDRIVGQLDDRYRMLSPDLGWTAFLVTALAIHLHRITRSEQFAIGVPVHNRSDDAVRRLIGPMMEVYPVDITVDTKATFAETHRSVSRSLLKTIGQAHPDVGVSAADVSGIVNVITGAGLGPFGATGSTTQWIHPGAADPQHMAGLQLTTYGSDRPTLFLDLNLGGAADRHGRRAPGHLQRILEAMVADPDGPIFGHGLVSDDEIDELERWGSGPLIDSTRRQHDTAAADPSGLLVDRLANGLAGRDAVALVDGERRLTGSQVWEHSGAVAGWLVAKGVGRGSRVAVAMGRSADAVLAILAILRTGASYVPVDPEQPDERRASLLERAGVELVLTELPDLSDQRNPMAGEAPEISPTDEAYVLFTSGSTGEPKGVPITHGGVADYLAFAQAHYLDGGNDRPGPVAPLFSALTFDLTVTSLFLPLLAGGTVVVVRPGSAAGVRAVADNADLTWLKATPSHLEALVRMLPAEHRLATIVVGGEAFSAGLARRLRSALPGVRLFNEYGPTEAVVGCAVHEYDDDDEPDVPIGRPVPGVRLAIMDPADNLVPEGVAGELMISSPGLSPGYLGDGPENEAFVAIHGERVYRSGDLVRLIDADTAMYLGRVDEQIKVNGIRLEPGEVVAGLEQHPAVVAAAVRLWEPEGQRPMLAAWFEVADGHVAPTAAELRSFLASRLAVHQIPVGFAPVESLPFNSNGKLDAGRLPEPERATSGEGTTGGSDRTPVADWTPTQQHVRTVWADVLGTVPGGVGDDFFALGGDSLAAIESAAALSERLGFHVAEDLVFAATTIGDLSAAIDGQERRAELSHPQPREIGTPPPLSARERAMLYDHRVDPASPRYNIGRRYHVFGSVDGDRLRSALEQVIARHEPLRWSFGSHREELPVEHALAWRDGVRAPLSVEVSRAAARAMYLEPFDLDHGPLVRAEFHRLDDGTSALALALHHISGDAGSLDRLWSDLDQAYQRVDDIGGGLAPLEVAYADHAAWQEHRLDQPDGLGSGDYWASRWRDDARRSFDLVAPLTPTNDGYLERPASFTAAELRQGPGATPTATALGALSALIGRCQGWADDESPVGAVAVGLAASVRDHRLAEPMVGYFLNTLPLVVDVEPTASLADCSKAAGRVLAEALPHRTYPFARMVADARHTGSSLPIPNVMLAVEDLAQAHLGELRVEHEILASGHAIAEATIFLQLRGEQVLLGIEYAGAVMDESRARLLLDDLDILIAASIHDGDRSAHDVALPSVAAGSLTGPDLDDVVDVVTSMRTNFVDRHMEPAVRCGERQLSWGDLDRRSAAIARQLLAAGVHRSDQVVVSMHRSTDLVASIVAVLRIGAAYVPVDPTYPADRIDRICAASSASVAIVEPGMALGGLLAVPVDPAALDLERPDRDPSTPGETRPGVPLDAIVDADDLAYVIFTSGSTGTPKGVPVTHGQLASSTGARAQVYRTDPERFLLLSSVGFDSSVVGLFWTLVTGGEIVVPTEAQVHDPDALLALFRTGRITDVLLVPSLYSAMLDRGRAQPAWPTRVIVAGEACTPDLVDRHHAHRPKTSLYNEYGPTEATVWSTVHRCVPGERPTPIGGPIPGVWIGVAGPDGQRLPLGVAGELVVGGAGVTNGYLDGGGEASSFLDHSPLGPGRAYRTGDLVALAGTEAVFLGRVDDQLNVGGLRIEPGEIEAIIAGSDGVASVAVTAASTGSRQVLVAHLEPAAGAATLDLQRVRSAVEAGVPAAARPAHYMVHASLPRTPHGKIDRRALAGVALPTESEAASGAGSSPAVEDAGESQSGGAEGADPMLAAVLEEFRRELRRPDVGPDDDFFEAGGDSLAALTLALSVEDRLGHRLSVTALLADPTARGVARELEGLASEAANDELFEWIRREPDAPVLLLMAPGSGHLLGYQPLINALVRLAEGADGQPLAIAGVRLPGHDGKRAPERSVEAQADAVESVIGHELEGRTVMIFGGSSGGLLTWELEWRAERDGRPFAGVMLQDTIHPEALRSARDLRGPARYVGLVRNDGVVAAGRAVAARIVQRIDDRRVRSEAMKAEADGEAVSPEAIARRLFSAADELSLRYEPHVIHRPAHFLAASHTSAGMTYETWQHFTPDLEVTVFDGDHYGEDGIASTKRVGAVAEHVWRQIDRLR